MDLNELEPVKKERAREDLDILSIQALVEYIEELEKEIVRAQDKISYKQKAREGAEIFFRK